MDGDTNDRLARMEKTLNDNNRMLGKMRRAQKRAAIWRLLWWAIIIFFVIEAYRFIKPYLEQAQSTYTNINTSINSLKSL